MPSRFTFLRFSLILILPFCAGCGSRDSTIATVGSQELVMVAPAASYMTRPDIPPVIGRLATFLASRDAEGAAALFVPEVRQEYKELFRQCPDIFETLGTAIPQASMTFQPVGPTGGGVAEAGQPPQPVLGELMLDQDGQTFSIKLRQDSGIWQIHSL